MNLKPQLMIPLNCHEAVVKHIDPKGYQADSVMLAFYAAMQTARTQAEKIRDIALVLYDDQTLTPAARSVKIKQATQACLQGAARAMDQARDSALKQLDALDRKSLPRKATNPHMATEIRQMLKSSSESERMAVLTAADEQTIAALVEAPNPQALCGVGPAQRAVLAENWRHKNFPTEAQRITNIKKALAAGEQAIKNLASFCRQTYDADDTEKHEKNQLRQQELSQ
jgi:hypothetical protein